MLTQFATQADQNWDVTEFLIESTKFDLPTEFLKMVANCRREKLSPEEAEVEYARSEKLRFQLIEGKSNGSK
jgi:trigger factor